jgi:hypothetical protein
MVRKVAMTLFAAAYHRHEYKAQFFTIAQGS